MTDDTTPQAPSAEDRRPEQWNAVDAIFEAALERPPEKREAFVAGACANAPALRAQVEALLEAAEAADPWIARSEALIRGAAYEAFSGEAVESYRGVGGSDDRHAGGRRAEGEGGHRDDLARADPEPTRARRIGAWRILRRLARGGMGDVYLAERADGQFEQRAALKLLRRGLDTDDILGRFLAERQILASLAHPNIARLLDGGATEDGRPYLVLEYVEGEPITEYCDGRGLGVEERLRLFVTACRAVQHAHRNLVLHRDLKPSNILVTGDGRVKLLDFGIAKLLDESAATEAPRTRTGLRLMTPEYASPEQVRGEPVTTASDVYQLGMMAYELLAGRRPYEIRNRSVIAMERIVGEDDPPPPSQRAGDVRSGGQRDRLRRRLRGDLDAVVLQALRKEPERRYGSVGQLVEDVERHLAGLPVRARGDGLLYRARKFARRRRWPLSASAALLLLVVGYLGMAAAQSARLARERDRARVEAAKTEEVKDFLVGLFDVADPAVTGGKEVTARQLVDEGARTVRRELRGQPAIRAEMLSALADVYRRLSLHERALALAREALEIRRALHERSPEESAPRLAESLGQVGLIAARYDDGEAGPRSAIRAEGATLLREAVEATRRAHGPRHPLYAQALHDHALWGDHTPERRRVLEDSAIAILRSAPESERPRLARVLAEAGYGTALERAIPLAEEALAIRREVYGEEHREVAGSLSDLALMLEPTNPDSAERLLRRALDVHRAAAGPRHPQTLTIQNNLAGILRDRGRFEEAVPLYEEVLSLRRAEGQPLVAQAYTMYGLAASFVELGRRRAAEPLLREVLEVFPAGSYGANAARLVLGRALIGQGRAEEAERVLRAALESAGKGGRGPVDDIRRALVDLYADQGRLTEAQRLREEEGAAGS